MNKPNERDDCWYCVKVPSNIAWLKYWGKEPDCEQWPTNNSLSMTLEHCSTLTRARRHDGGESLILDLSGAPLPSGQVERARRHLARLQELHPQGAQSLEIRTHNTFPTGSGIASSASGLGALTLAAIAAWNRAGNWEELLAAGFDRQCLAHLARRGSGSAGRSFWGGWVHWQRGGRPEEQRFGTVAGDECSAFASPQLWDICDTIVLVSHAEKAVSSSAGHRLASTSPFFQLRLTGFPEREQNMLAAIKNQRMDEAGPLLEQEALDMHSIMLTSRPPANYLTPTTFEILLWVRRRRLADHLPIYFTLDAGPNVHILCESAWQNILLRALRVDFPGLKLIQDRVGSGPKLWREEALIHGQSAEFP